MIQVRVVLGAAAVAALACGGSAASAQEHSYSQEVEIYGGEIFGDRLTETTISDSTPRLNDADTLGARYNFNFNRSFGVQLEVGYSPRVTTGHVASGNTDGVLVGCDLDAGWTVLPDFKFQGHSMVPYIAAGAGYAWLLNLHKMIE